MKTRDVALCIFLAASGLVFSQNPREFVVGPNWMPKKEETSLVFARTLDMLLTAALKGAETGKEPVPTEIVAGFRWLMTVQEAEKLLPNEIGTPTKISSQCMPNNTLHTKVYNGKFIPEPATGEVFRQCRLTFDAKLQLISVQYNQPRAADVSFEPLSTGVFSTYFDFQSVKMNSVAGRKVSYQVTHPRAGVACIHTALDYFGRASGENVRWYLPLPFAGKIKEITSKYKE